MVRKWLRNPVQVSKFRSVKQLQTTPVSQSQFESCLRRFWNSSASWKLHHGKTNRQNWCLHWTILAKRFQCMLRVIEIPCIYPGGMSRYRQLWESDTMSATSIKIRDISQAYTNWPHASQACHKQSWIDVNRICLTSWSLVEEFTKCH